MKLFFTSFSQIALVAINTMLLSKSYVIGIFMASFTISFIWCYNVSKVSVSSLKSKLIYSFGAGFGAVFGWFLVHLLT